MEKRNSLLPNYGEIKSFCRLNGSFEKPGWAAGLIHLLFDEFLMCFTGCIPEQHGSNTKLKQQQL
jgi:hypothetical protein